MIRKVIKELLPPFLTRSLTGLFYGWKGNFPSWDKAVKKCSGYNSKVILEQVAASVSKVKNGEAFYERDSMLFDKIEYSFQLLSGLLWVAAQNNGKLNVLDFGGSLGSSYYQNKVFLDSLTKVNWCIVEQSDFVKIGIDWFQNDKLHFFYSIEECLKSYNIDVVVLSSVLQYLEEPYSLLGKIKSAGIEYLIIDRTPFISGKDRITVQKVKSSIYKGSYPCWFFNETDFISYISEKFNLVLDFDALDKANIRSEFKGFIFQKKQS
ncbi:MAG: methyltransferase, TIGR04325 family [Bacteroidetes bacterium]|nr:MAG: methyltransferase, TIGR04325 family [Bacteroidota bacterium]